MNDFERYSTNPPFSHITSHILHLAGGWRSRLHNNYSPVRSRDRGTGNFLSEGGIHLHAQRFQQDCSCTLEETNKAISLLKQWKYYSYYSNFNSVSPYGGELFIDLIPECLKEKWEKMTDSTRETRGSLLDIVLCKSWTRGVQEELKYCKKITGWTHRSYCSLALCLPL